MSIIKITATRNNNNNNNTCLQLFVRDYPGEPVPER